MCRLNGIKTCVKTGVNTLLRLRVGISETRYHGVSLPVFYLINKHLHPRDKITSAISLFSIVLTVIATVILTLIFLKFYVFEADIQLIYLDTTEDILRENRQYLHGYHYDDWDNRKIFFSATGWKYVDTFRDSVYKINLQQSNDSTSDSEEYNNRGYWITTPPVTSESGSSHIDMRSGGSSGKVLLKNFQFLFSHEVGLALRFYIGGMARIYITFGSSAASTTHSIAIHKGISDSEDSQQNGFCTLFIDPPFGGHVKKIDIAAIATNPTSFVAIDKIAMAVGNDKRSLHMLYTLLPQGWCSSAIKIEKTEMDAS